ncbi:MULTISPECIES: dihydroxyacetone kinase family protein [Curtobacterium]|uniref:Dihydroxyacetone kinase family protein n=1 Tax=Curtobacterium poinsettiae TaxID=159612 RepID=A0ABT3S0Z5_9MICO|nr:MULTISPECIES: dihydroxyacetone kinase family protein [Curtobacterium]KQR27127.1 dihydroxyacetone kinase [Curtobacterium sp. Leaf154]MBT1608643.1 dihydroxyacetone kinase family protein [Curtobacterium flaccumfaciens pv. poinsettiae]MBT1618189.1 dihydroxyacetone kinase family protein [Curtobacterium flaccumfaciens pv. poinsettiae]MCS6563727.1 dihydroxyacetone kinase family protein [Curtobacterium flaccumfaciens pv. flaccumfaciens]MCU0152418.1 dihydroxyacetone kinase family protein [Curtobacte
MTRLFNDPADFADEATDGFVAANERWVRKVHGGVARATTSPDGTVAVVIGGGSGHYPAFGGLVGHGLAAGAAMGNLFASPSAQQVTGVAKAAEHGGGVLLSYGNYAGDVLNFDAAARTLEADGIPVRTVRVTDDVTSAPADDRAKRRGIAGDLCVFKVAGAAAERGDDLDTVTAVAERANDRTRSFGVAFSGCSLPGAEEPLFTVPEGRMAVGMGIHGERGIDETDVPTADGLAELLVCRLLDELPDGVALEGQRVVPILNGLGSVKYEELFVVYRSVQRRLADAGVVIVEPEVGELVTSFDMAGVSLTLFWLDDELEELWAAPADTPAYRKGGAVAEQRVDPSTVAADAEGVGIGQATDESRAVAEQVAAGFAAVRAVLDEHADELGRIDAVAGDGDHGIGMQRGSHAADVAAADAVSRGAGAGTVLLVAADAWSDKAGGTSGAIWGAALEALGRVVGDDSRPSGATVAQGVRAATEAVLAFGATVGDKTMVDALVPFDEVLRTRLDAGAALAEAWGDAARAARQAADATESLVPRMGRARTHADQAVGTADPGALSFALVVETVAP